MLNLMTQLKLKRVVTGYRCHEMSCYETAVWYAEIDAEFFHWCPKHAVKYMGNRDYWRSKLMGKARTGKRAETEKSLPAKRTK